MANEKHDHSIIKDKRVKFENCKTCGRQMLTVDRDSGVEFWPNCECGKETNGSR